MSLFDFLRDAPPYVPLWPDGGSKRINFDKRFNLHTEEGNVGGKRAEHIWIDLGREDLYLPQPRSDQLRPVQSYIRSILHLATDLEDVLTVLAATLESTGKIPVAGLAIVYGIDRFMSEIRTLTNFIGNTVGTLVVAKWDGALDMSKAGEILIEKK